MFDFPGLLLLLLPLSIEYIYSVQYLRNTCILFFVFCGCISPDVHCLLLPPRSSFRSHQVVRGVLPRAKGIEELRAQVDTLSEELEKEKVGRAAAESAERQLLKRAKSAEAEVAQVRQRGVVWVGGVCP